MTQQSRAAPQASTSAQPTPANSDDGGNIKETIESILVAFILAFIFRAFVVEAFIIPTGSMAPTLLGAHMSFRCPDCGYTFTVNYSTHNGQSEDESPPSDGYPPADIYCPNCGFHVASPEMRSPTPPYPVRYGDRILVLKYLYLLHPPQRWDVVVFKSPDNPQTFHYEQNYIKRLVGLPGERLMVLDGNIYIADAQNPQWHIPKDKTRQAQEALWRLVYDNDFYPQHSHRDGLPDWVQPWKPVSGSGWDQGTGPSDGRTFRFNNPAGMGALLFDPNANSTTQTLTDYLVYDTGPQQKRTPGAVGSPDDESANPVSDLKLVAYYNRTSGDGPLRLRLSRSDTLHHAFTAEINRDSVRLIQHTDTGDSDMTKPLTELGIRGDKPIFIEFANVDYRITLRLNGKDAFPPIDYQPDIPALISQYHSHKHGQPGQAEIDAANQTCTLDHISLWRDVYYTNRDNYGGKLPTATPDNPVQLGPQEFFVMGDNSAVSEDARYWNEPIDLPHEGLDMAAHRVPAQFMLGKAVFVYWPAGFRALEHLSIIPDFGDMRWIH